MRCDKTCNQNTRKAYMHACLLLIAYACIYRTIDINPGSRHLSGDRVVMSNSNFVAYSTVRVNTYSTNRNSAYPCCRRDSLEDEEGLYTAVIRKPIRGESMVCCMSDT